jgi:homoserine kinase
VSNATVGGNLVNTTLVNQNTNAAIGLGSSACSEIGAIGKSDVCG